MTKDEYTKALRKEEDDNAQVDDDYGSGYSVALQEAISLLFGIYRFTLAS
ncbi:hypothetical protein PS410_02255 [Pediococcus acidilactici]